MPWGVTFPAGSPAHVYGLLADPVLFLAGPQPVHPTQIYEAILVLASAAIAGTLLVRNAPWGTAFCAFALGYALARWGIFYLRPPPESNGLLHYFQPALYAAIILAAGGTLVVSRMKRARATAPGPGLAMHLSATPVQPLQHGTP